MTGILICHIVVTLQYSEHISIVASLDFFFNFLYTHILLLSLKFLFAHKYLFVDKTHKHTKNKCVCSIGLTSVHEFIDAPLIGHAWTSIVFEILFMVIFLPYSVTKETRFNLIIRNYPHFNTHIPAAPTSNLYFTIHILL